MLVRVTTKYEIHLDVPDEWTNDEIYEEIKKSLPAYYKRSRLKALEIVDDIEDLDGEKRRIAHKIYKEEGGEEDCPYEMF